jgi:hypothetical protein
MILNVGSVVEGHGDVEAVPILLRRLQQAIRPDLLLNTGRPVRISRYKLVKEGELERAIRLAANKVGAPRAVLVLVDSDDDCPAELGPQLRRRAEQIGLGIPIGVVLAKHEYEAWFLAAFRSLCGRRGLASELPEVPDPENVRGAKGLLNRHMTKDRAYSEPADQPALTARFDLHLARRRSDSFDKCWREVQRLLDLAGQSK